MKIQSLAIIAIIIILPMSILLTEYTQNQMKTIKTQIQYDSKLSNATYDAIKAFQQNMSNSSTAHLADSKMRDIKGSINIFFDSLGSNLNMSGYGKEVLQNYVPAVVYTLYDGYYIYSAYNNTLDIVRDSDNNDEDIAQRDTFDENASYKDGVEIYGLRPYVYYSCRYVKEGNIDVVITYSLDSFITIQGKIGNKSVNESGYLLTGVDKDDNQYKYNGIIIESENILNQNVYIENVSTELEVDLIKIDDDIAGSIKNYPCKKINGVKYYKEGSNKIISILNDKKYSQFQISEDIFKENSFGVQFYKDAYEFKQKFINGELKELINLRVEDAVDLDNNRQSKT